MQSENETEPEPEPESESWRKAGSLRPGEILANGAIVHDLEAVEYSFDMVRILFLGAINPIVRHRTEKIILA